MMVLDLGFRNQGSEFRAESLRVWCLRFRDQVQGFREVVLAKTVYTVCSRHINLYPPEL
jgi:hypothetical protein